MAMQMKSKLAEEEEAHALKEQFCSYSSESLVIRSGAEARAVQQLILAIQKDQIQKPEQSFLQEIGMLQIPEQSFPQEIGMTSFNRQLFLELFAAIQKHPHLRIKLAPVTRALSIEILNTSYGPEKITVLLCKIIIAYEKTDISQFRYIEEILQHIPIDIPIEVCANGITYNPKKIEFHSGTTAVGLGHALRMLRSCQSAKEHSPMTIDFRCPELFEQAASQVIDAVPKHRGIDLILSYDSFTRFNAKALSVLSQRVRTLKLNYCTIYPSMIEELTSYLQSNTHVNGISLQNCKIPDLPSFPASKTIPALATAIAKLKNLYTLDLSSLPSDVVQIILQSLVDNNVTTLTNLYLDNIKINGAWLDDILAKLVTNNPQLEVISLALEPREAHWVSNVTVPLKDINETQMPMFIGALHRNYSFRDIGTATDAFDFATIDKIIKRNIFMKERLPVLRERLAAFRKLLESPAIKPIPSLINEYLSLYSDISPARYLDIESLFSMRNEHKLLLPLLVRHFLVPEAYHVCDSSYQPIEDFIIWTRGLGTTEATEQLPVIAKLYLSRPGPKDYKQEISVLNRAKVLNFANAQELIDMVFDNMYRTLSSSSADEVNTILKHSEDAIRLGYSRARTHIEVFYRQQLLSYQQMTPSKRSQYYGYYDRIIEALIDNRVLATHVESELLRNYFNLRRQAIRWQIVADILPRVKETQNSKPLLHALSDSSDVLRQELDRTSDADLLTFTEKVVRENNKWFSQDPEHIETLKKIQSELAKFESRERNFPVAVTADKKIKQDVADKGTARKSAASKNEVAGKVDSPRTAPFARVQSNARMDVSSCVAVKEAAAPATSSATAAAPAPAPAPRVIPAPTPASTKQPSSYAPAAPTSTAPKAALHPPAPVPPAQAKQSSQKVTESRTALTG